MVQKPYKNITKSYGGEVTHFLPSEVEAKASQADVARQRLDYNTYEPDIKAWQVRAGELHPEYAWQERRMRTLGSGEKYTPYARGLVGQSRGQQQAALALLADRARGGSSIARMEAENQRRQIAQGIASQLASQRGRMPSAVRGAQMAQGKSMVDLAAQTEVAAAKEKLAAQQAYSQAAAGIRGQDISMFGAEQQQEQALRQWLAAKEKMAMDYRRMGLGEKYSTAGLRQQYEQMQMAQDMALLDQAIRLQTGGQGGGGTNWGQVMGGIGGMVGGLGLLALSDERAKEDIEYLTPSGEQCKQALQSGNTALYNYLQAQASQAAPASEATPYVKDYSDYPGYKIGESKPAAPTSTAPTSTAPKQGSPTYMIPGVGGYGGVKKEYYPHGYTLPDDYIEGWKRGWRAPSGPTIDLTKTQTPAFGLVGENTLQSPLTSPLPPQQKGPLPEPKTGPQYWMPDKVPSDEACKQALASGNTALYNYLQAQQTGEALDKQFDMNPTMNTLGANPSAWNPTMSTLGAQPGNISPIAPTKLEPIETTGEEAARAQAAQQSLDAAIKSGQTSEYTRTGGVPTGAGDINPDYSVSMTPSQAAIASGEAKSGGGDYDKAAAAQGIGMAFQGMGQIIGEIDRAERRKESTNPENWAGVSKGTPRFASSLDRYMRPGSSYDMGMGMITSDEECKRDISDDAKLKDFLDKMDAVQFNYKDEEKHGYGRRTGVIAQDVAASELGDGMVARMPDGHLALDVSPQKFNPLVLASLAHLHDRVRNLEGE